jgi:hypothetical protein
VSGAAASFFVILLVYVMLGSISICGICFIKEGFGLDIIYSSSGSDVEADHLCCLLRNWCLYQWNCFELVFVLVFLQSMTCALLEYLLFLIIIFFAFSKKK